jgi:cytochrome c(L)
MNTTGGGERRWCWSLLVACALAAGAARPALAQNKDAPPKLNKYTGDPAAIKEGRKLFMKYGCSACHGVGGGGGGMGPPLIDDQWRYGSDDGTLFKLITGQIPESKMPKVFELQEEDVWKILAYVRSLYAGDPDKVNW